MIDFHSHVIPFIDDGASDLNEAESMLLSAKNQGISTIIATPHFNPYFESVEDFIKKRDLNYQKLLTVCPEGLTVIPGAEVKLVNNLSKIPNIKDLCIKGTNLILIEPPKAPWPKYIFNEIFNIAGSQKVTPIIAHVERYAKNPGDVKKISKLLYMDVIIQLSIDSFSSVFKRRILKEILKMDQKIIVSSDAHNSTYRKYNFDAFKKSVIKHFGPELLEMFYDNAIEVYNNGIMSNKGV